MSILDDIRTIGLKMKNEQASLKEIILESSRVDVSDEQVDGLDRLIYNLLVEFFLNYMRKK